MRQLRLRNSKGTPSLLTLCNFWIQIVRCECTKGSTHGYQKSMQRGITGVDGQKQHRIRKNEKEGGQLGTGKEINKVKNAEKKK